MPTPAEVQQFVQHWEKVTLNEKAVAQSHFNALCKLLGLKGPVEADPSGTFFRFEKPLTKSGGKQGFADVWYQGRFAVEYKTKGKYATLREAYSQLELYKDDLANPPVLIACDIARYEVHVVFTGYTSRIHTFTNQELENASVRELLRLAFTAPEELRPVEPVATITKAIAGRFAEVAQSLEGRFAPTEIAHFFMKMLFALFAEDVKLLPAELMSKSIRKAILNPSEFPDRARGLFRAMREGGYFGVDRVPCFDGWLFNDDEVLPLNADELTLLADAARHDWTEVEPGIFGTLFERGLDRAKRAQLGAHYTSREDILLIVEPVLLQPLRREWAEIKTGLVALRDQWEQVSSSNARFNLQSVAEGMLFTFADKLSTVRVLDPACGSGNFLYVALTALKDLELDVWDYAGGLGLRQPDLNVSPAQFFGIEKNPFAAELAQVVIWIGYLQWQRVNKRLEGWPKEPILKVLHTIENRDALMTVGLDGQPAEPPWPEVEVIIGNPPFLGSKRLRGELGDPYFDALQALYGQRVAASMDLVTYWFERARVALTDKKVHRVGFLATNSIRQQRNRSVLESIKETGDIFMAWDDRPWVLEGAAVRVSLVGFDNGTEKLKRLNGIDVSTINADLTSELSIAAVRQLAENEGLAFMGNIKVGPFGLTAIQAAEMLALTNASGRPNRDVVRPLAGGDITGRPKDEWIIDFGPTMAESEAVLYEAPFAYVQAHVKPEREKNNRASYRRLWWLHGEPRPALWQALKGTSRYIVTVLVAKHRLFAWLPSNVAPAARLIVFAREDDYFFGMLHARPHELWALRLGARHGGERPTYNNTTCFETYPFPWAPGTEPTDDPRVTAIAAAARALVEQRDEWLNPTSVGALDGVKQRTLTNLYNQRPDWLSEAHRRLDEAVFAAYGWPADLSDEAILTRLLALNLERASAKG